MRRPFDWEDFEEMYGESREEHTCPVCRRVETFFCAGWQDIEENT